jgi:phosphatidylserine/phosphatidylglycerophosphate/cardiolipin synthase-like enzyme
MKICTTVREADMAINVKVYDNGDHTCLVWLPADQKPMPDCRGFTVRRLLNGTESYLHGFVGFSDDDKLDPANPWKFPLQRYMWWDYGVKPGDKVQYSIVPVVGKDRNSLALDSAEASALTAEMTITGQVTQHVSAYFNKGIVAAQWVSRALAAQGKKPKIADIIADPKNPLRIALSGLLRPQILSLLQDTKNKGGEVYAALYELNDPELLAGLTAFGKKCHLVLANGAFKPPDNDENKKVRADLKDKVDLYNRMVPQGHFAHNKFVVFCDSGGTPERVLTGSTNWTVTGLCTQANNGLIVDDPDVAKYFLDEWNHIKDAGSGYPDTFAQFNSTSKTFPLDGGTVTQWFVPTTDAQDLEFARKLISAAKDGILFLFFNPGVFAGPDKPEKQWTLLQNILARDHDDKRLDFDPNLYIRGVVNQEIAGLTTEDSARKTKRAVLDPAEPANPVTLFSGAKQPPQRLRYDAMVPKNIKETFHNWETEILGSGVHIHSKVIVLDPFGENPVVMAGSHNLGYKASHANDDNLMIVQGNAPLAAAYAANIIAIYQTYRWNAYVEAHRQDPQVWHGLVDSDKWQDSYLDENGGDLTEILFWLGQHAASGAPPVPPPPPGPAPDGTRPRAVTATGPAPGSRRKPRKGPGKGTRKTAKRKETNKAPAKKRAPAKRTKIASTRKKKKKPTR